MNDRIINDDTIAKAVAALRQNFLESGSFVKEWQENFVPKMQFGQPDEYELVIKIRTKR